MGRNQNILINANERKEHRRRASQKLELSLSQRPTFSDVVERGILMNENEHFNERIRELLALIEGSLNNKDPNKRKMYGVTEDIKDDYHSMIARLNGQISEYKQTLNQFQDDVQSREQRLRQELENKQRVLIHMNGIIEQQKNDQLSNQQEYEQKINQIQQEYKEKLLVKSKLNPAQQQNINNDEKQIQLKQHLEYLRSIGNALQSQLTAYAQTDYNKLQQIQQQKQNLNNTIDRLYDISTSLASNNNTASKQNDDDQKEKQYLENKKKEMVKLVNDKMRDLKYIHQQELQKERQIANVLVANHQKQMEALQERQGTAPPTNNKSQQSNQQMMQMKQQMEELKKMYRKSLMENEQLKQSKKKLEKLVVKLSSDIVQTANKK